MKGQAQVEEGLSRIAVVKFLLKNTANSSEKSESAVSAGEYVTSQNGPIEKKSGWMRLLADCDSLLKSGRIHEVGARLASLTIARVPREFRQELAKVCRRAGLVETGLRLLQPIVRSERPSAMSATPGEVAEYAYLLARNGSRKEAISLLEKVDPTKMPAALLYRASCLIEEWDYAQAAPLLERFIAGETDDYARLIASVNLGVSYVAIGRFQAAEVLLTGVLATAQTQGANRLAGNCLEILGNLAIQVGDFSRARSYLERATSVFAEGASRDHLLITKWLAVIESFETKSREPIERFRALAVKGKHWESVRQADLFALELEFRQSDLDHLYFGTPLAGFRAAILNQVQGSPSRSYLLGDGEKNVLDLENGRFDGGFEDEQAASGKIHLVLKALASDFYLLHGTGSLFAAIYPEEYFNVETSPNKVRQVLFRARRWLEEQGVQNAIVCDGSRYGLACGKEFSIRIPLEASGWEFHTTRWQNLSERFAQQPGFTAKEAEAYLGLSQTSFHRLKQWALKSGLLERVGQGKLTQYRVRPVEKSRREEAA